MTNTVKLHRVMRTSPEKLYRAFIEPEAFTRWLPPCGFVAKLDHLDARVNGTYQMAFINFSTGNGHSFGGRYLELIPSQRLRYSSAFDDPNMPGEMCTERQPQEHRKITSVPN